MLDCLSASGSYSASATDTATPGRSVPTLEINMADFLVKIRSTKAMTELLGKLGIPSCIQHRMTSPGWSGPGGKPYIKYGLVASEIHEFVNRQIILHKQRSRL